ncbi:MAG: S8 family serine peptidase, partial [Candidatus Cloacimonetes bacterium]|nr:S8 family serine peptidase [Candidatus Cloacimonadota bacterium]
MKQNLIIAIFLVFIGTMLYSVELPFIEEYYQPRSIIVAIAQEAVGNRFGDINFTREDGIIRTHIESLNLLAMEYRFVDLHQLHEKVTYLDWNDKGVYLQNIYRIVLEENDNIETALSALNRDNNIIFAEYESINRYLYTPNDPEYSLQWHHPVVMTPEAWDHVQGSSEVIVAITDSGTKWNHPDLADNIWINEAELPGITIDWVNGMIYGGDGIDNDGNGFIDDVIGWDFVENNNNPYQNYPGNGHGTHVAGCAGAVGDNNIGLTGTAMNVSLLICKGAPSNAPSSGIQYAYQQVQYAAQSGAHIINCSWIGQGQGNYANSVVNYATSLGSLVVAGAGNNGIQHTPTNAWFPSDCTNSLSVAATGQNDIMANFSDYGEPIDLTAPGVNIRSTYLNNTYQSSSGTSMSSPVAAGIAALVKSLHPDISPLDLKARLMTTTDYIDDINDPGFAGLIGTGRINAFKATMYDKIPYISIYQHTLQEHSGDGDGVPNPGEEINLIFALYNELYWLTATGVTATLSTEAPGVEILIDTVNFPNISGGSVVLNTTNPFRFTTEATLSNLTIPFTLTITANQGNPFPYEASFYYEVKLSLQQANWPFALSGTSNSSALLLDLDGDVRREIIFGDSQGNLWALKHNKTPLPGFPVNLGSNISAAVAAADLNNNGTTEIIANSQSGLINCVTPTGDILFQYNAGGQLRSNPMLVDVNNNGNLEIVALTFSNPRLIILNHDGTDFPGFPVTISAAVLSSPASADLNGDGHKEIIFNTSGGSLHAISTVTGTDIDGWPKSIGSAS